MDTKLTLIAGIAAIFWFVTSAVLQSPKISNGVKALVVIVAAAIATVITVIALL